MHLRPWRTPTCHALGSRVGSGVLALIPTAHSPAAMLADAAAPPDLYASVCMSVHTTPGFIALITLVCASRTAL